MTSSQIRQSFLDFFKSKQHTIVPSSSLMPDSPNLLFTNAGMNQFVPIFLGQTKCPYTPGRAADTQKCIRAGGKHNDLDDVGLDTYHHTFFEMLGNWSFGDYFKKEAIEWAWELVVPGWQFPPQRLYATVFCPYLGEPGWEKKWAIELEQVVALAMTSSAYIPPNADASPFEIADQEAAMFWAKKFSAAGCDPKMHIIPGNKKDNFWMMGETGPCGPCSELHVDLTPAGDTRGGLVNKGSAQCIEIWNLVFIQFNANADGTFAALPAQHVDTGMGFERVTSIIQGTKNFTDFAHAKISNYETDIFRPIFDELEKLSGKKYGSTLPAAMGGTGDSPVPVGDPPTGMEATSHLQERADSQLDVTSHSAGLVTRRHGQVARATQGSAGDQPAADGNLPSAGQTQMDIAFRVIADHIRTLSFAIADGIQPGNKERNAVVRRILRRAAMFGRSLGFHEPFIYRLVSTLAEAMGDVFPEIRANQAQIARVIQEEEEAFNKTLDRGMELFEEGVKGISAIGPTATVVGMRPVGPPQTGKLEILRDGSRIETTYGSPGIINGKIAFKLHATYGLPIEEVERLARERGLKVDIATFNALNEEHRIVSGAGQIRQVIELSQIETTTPTKFVGFDQLQTPAKVLEVVSLKNKTAVILDTSSCYAEMGGQVGDTGELTGSGQLWRVTNTQKSGNTWLHFIECEANKVGQASRLPSERTSASNETNPAAPISSARAGETPTLLLPGSIVTLTVDKSRRNAIQRHHTVTHLLHWALHEIADNEASQKGSFVGQDKLTFDFNSAPLTSQQIADIEKLVNEKIVENAPVTWTEVKHNHVKDRKDVMQFFGDKYGEWVRVVQIGGKPTALDGYSMELCGGTHVRATGEIGLFRIVAESAIAAGVRRIEAVAGLEAYKRANDEVHLIKTLAAKVNSPVHELEKKIESLLAHQKELEKEIKIALQRNASNAASELLSRAQNVNGIPFIAHNLGVAEPDFLQAIADALKGRFQGVIVLGGHKVDAVTLICAVTPDFTAKVQAGKIIQTIAPIVGGKGGGKPDNARGGGKDAGKLDEALARAKSLLG